MSLDLQCPLCGKAGIPSEYIYWLHVHRKHLQPWRTRFQRRSAFNRGRQPCGYCGRGIYLRYGMWIFDCLQYFHVRCWFKCALESQLAK